MHPNHTALKRVIAFLAMLGILALSVPFALIAEEPSAEVPSARSLSEIVGETNPVRSAFLAVSYNGLPDVAAGDTVALIAKLSGYEGLEYTVYWQYYSETVVDEQSTFAWFSDEEKFGPVYSLTLTRANSGIIRRVKIVITGISGYPEETTGTVTDYSDERPAIIGELAVRAEVPAEVLVTEISAEELIAEKSVTEIPAEEPAEETPAIEIPAEEPVEETPAAEIPAEEPVEETPVAEIPPEEPVEETPAMEIPTEEPVEETPAAEIPAEEPAAETLAAEIPAEEPAAETLAAEVPAEGPAAETPVTEVPAEEPAAETLAAEIPAEEPAAETLAAEIPAEEPAVETPASEVPAEEPAVETPATEVSAEELAVETPAPLSPAPETQAVETPPEASVVPEVLPIAETIDSTHPDRSVSVAVSWVNDVLGIGDAVTLTAVLNNYDGVETEIAWQYDRGNGVWTDAGSGSSHTFILSLDNFAWNWRAAVIPLRYSAE